MESIRITGELKYDYDKLRKDVRNRIELTSDPKVQIASIRNKEIASGYLLRGYTGFQLHSFSFGNDLFCKDFSIENFKQYNSSLNTYSNSIILSTINDSNYYHYLTESLPVIIELIRSFNSNFKIRVLPVKANTSILRLICPGYDFKFLSPNSISRLRNCFVFNTLPTYFHSKDYLLEIQDRVITSLEDNNSSSKVVYIKRNKNDFRSITNENEIISFLESRFKSFQVLDTGLADIYQQINIMREAEIVISIHGAQLTNILWAKDLKHLVEIDLEPRIHYRNLCEVLGIKYWYLKSERENSADINGARINFGKLRSNIKSRNFNQSIDILKLNLILNSLL